VTEKLKGPLSSVTGEVTGVRIISLGGSVATTEPLHPITKVRAAMRRELLARRKSSNGMNPPGVHLMQATVPK
jgi:hypothetical protein